MLGLRFQKREGFSSRNGTVDKAKRVAAQPELRMDICDCPLARTAQAQGLSESVASGEWRAASGESSLTLSSSAAYTPHWVVVVFSAGLLFAFRSPCAPL